METLELDGDSALFEGKIQGIILTCHENERPLQGLAGLMDWRFEGALSRFIQAGFFSGKPGECVYVPVTKLGKTYHILLVGAGKTPFAGRRGQVPPESLKILKKNLSTLKLTKLGASRSDFGNVNTEFFSKHLGGADLRVVP